MLVLYLPSPPLHPEALQAPCTIVEPEGRENFQAGPGANGLLQWAQLVLVLPGMLPSSGQAA